MQLLPILLIAVVLAADAGLSVVSEPAGSGLTITVIACLPPVLILAAQWVGVRLCLRALARGRGPGPIMAAERMASAARMLMVLNHAAAVLLFGWLLTVRQWIGDLVLVDEMIVITPPLAGALLTWAVHYPVEKRLREVTLIRRLDEGRPIHPMPSRWRYVWRQAQLHVLLLLIPVLIILGASEVISDLAQRWLEQAWAAPVSQFATLGAGVAVFVFAPALVRVLFTTQRIEEGELRHDLLDVCERHNVRVRELLLWKTDGTMINAAVMGLVAPLRYVLITDALLETMRREEVRAVMAHEIGHVRRHHMPWLVLCLIALLAIVQYAVVTPLSWMEGTWLEVGTDVAAWIDLGATTGIVAVVLLGFGWVSRRFERQADTFAAQHLSGLGMPQRDDDDGAVGGDEAAQQEGLEQRRERSISRESVGALRNALLTICRLHSIDPRRRSWRHGSIAWRIEYLESIVGRPLERLPIDNVIRRLKIAAAVCVVATIGVESYLYSTPGQAEASPTAGAMGDDVGTVEMVDAGEGGRP